MELILYLMAKILVSWIGYADLKGGLEDPMSGPLVSVLKEYRFDNAYLLHNQSPDECDAFTSRLNSEFSTSFEVVKADLRSPIHFADIYKALDTTLSQVVGANPGLELYIQLSSGTPAMTSVSILTGKTKYKAKFLQSSKEQGVQEVDVPFDIAADFLPSVSEILDGELTNLIAYTPPSTAEFDQIITNNPVMIRLKERAAILAVREVPVLIFGETGTGKELFARAIHNTSHRSEKPFVALNCGAIPSELIDSTLFGHVKGAFTGASANRPGVFEQADGGTLFLDEFGELPADAQVRLLRVLQDGTFVPVGAVQEKKVNVRIVVATNRNLAQEVAEGNFREDLFYRVAIGVLNLPPLKDRQGDQWLLAENMIEQINKEAASQPGYENKKISIGAKKVILNHVWPGNVRELYATLLRASLWGSSSSLSETDIKEAMLGVNASIQPVLDRDVSQGIDINGIISEVSTHYIKRAMAEANGSKKKAAELLSLKNYQTLNNWMDKYGIE